MATRFMRLDLSDEAKDFRPVALEPGVPMLDKSGANAKILFRWLGGMLAEPSWEGESVNFFVRDDRGGRLEEVACQPATDEDLKKTLKQDLANLKDRIEKAKPETPTERAVKKMIRRSFDALVDDPGRTDLDCYFFKYRDVHGNWRLIWCWGYQRADQEPATSVVCGEADCNLLFVRRPKQSPKCPCCAAAYASGTKKKSHFERNALVLLLLLLLVGGGVYWYLHPNRLVATPGTYTGPVGGRVELKIVNVGLFPFLAEDVTSQAVGIVLDPAVASYDQMAAAALLVGPGTTYIRFRMGDLTTKVTLVSGVRGNPKKIAIEPGNVELGIGTTARLKLVGTYDDGAEVDLTDAAEWTAQNDGIVYAYDGLLEGLGEGNTTVAARYRADGQTEYLNATATVSVAEIEMKALELAIDPLPIGAGCASELRIDAVSADDERYSVLESSRLSTNVQPNYLAKVEARHIKGRQVGSGRLAATFNETLAADIPFDVALLPGLDRLSVAPEKLEMVVGQITDLSILSPSDAPVHVSSPDPSLVEVTAENRLIARAEGQVDVEVAQGNQRRTVGVTITTAEFLSIQVDPGRIVVPLDDTVRARILAHIRSDAGLRKVEISADLLGIDETPSPRYVDLDPWLLELRGVMPTDPSVPQALGVYFAGHRASAPVEVIVPPLRLTLTPAGPIELPLGQQMRLQGWATYGGGRRVGVVASRLRMKGRPGEDAKPGLELRENKVAALQAGAGPLEVVAGYFGNESKPVLFTSVEADPGVVLQLEIDRAIRLVDETGRVLLSATSPKGDVELVPEMAQYTSSDPTVLKIDEKTGAFLASAPGQVTITCNHAAATQSAELTLKVYDPADVQLLFEPASLRIAIDEVAPLQLFLEARDGDQIEREEMTGPGVGYVISRPGAVRWAPPRIAALGPAGPVEISASYYPLLATPATARIDVVPAARPAAIRIVPSALSLAPGQTISLRVEQQLADTPEIWTEIRPDAVDWTVQPGLIWSPSTGGLRPAVTCPEEATGEFELQVDYAGKRALALITTKTSGPDVNDPAATVRVVREPAGRFLPLGRQQRYSIVVEKDGAVEPAARIVWPGDFENEYVRWEAPVLTAKKAGYRQWLRAEVDGRAVLFHTTTYLPTAGEPPQPDPDRPVAVKILSDQGQSVQFPVGAEFDDFRVEAHYSDGFTQLVTKKATLRTAEPAESSPLSVSVGRLLGVRPGQTEVHAEFYGVRSQTPLAVAVTAGVDVDELRIVPAPITMLLGEMVALDVVGYKNGNSVGILTGLGNIAWQSTAPQVVRVDGPAATAMALGQATVTARLGGITSTPAPINVVDSIADALVIDPGMLRIHVGQSARIGTDLAVLRGPMDLSSQCGVTSSLPSVVRYEPQTHSLVGVSPGASAVAFTFGDKLTNVMVEVLPSGGPIDGEVVVEPSSGNLAPGQALDLRVYVVTADGYRIDRTGSAVLTSSDPGAVTIQGNLACALAPGMAEISVALPGTQNAGRAHVSVSNDPITDLIVEPPQLAMSAGQIARLRILGTAAGGTHLMFPQSDLIVAPGGPDPGAIQIVGASDVNAIRPGQASVELSWKNQLNRQVPVSVTNNPLTDLRLEPASALVYPGQPLVYQVTALRGGQRVVLGPEQGVTLTVSDRSVAQPGGGLAVMGTSPGRTSVFAGVGGQQIEAILEVMPGTAVIGTGGVIGPGVGIYDPSYVVRHGYGHGGDVWVDDVFHDRIVGTDVIGPGVYVGPPMGDVVGLRFVPDVLRLSPGAGPTPVRVVEVLANGFDGRDVTGDPALELTQPPDTVTIEQTEAGPAIRPIAMGRTTVGARLGTLTADPLLVTVGNTIEGLGQLVVSPSPLTLWSGEIGTFDSVLVDPGAGQPLRPVGYRVTPTPGDSVVASEGEQSIRGLANGFSQVTVTAIDPGGPYDGLSTTATVEVTSSGRLWVTPAQMALSIGQPTPPISVMTDAANGLPVPVDGILESMDPAVVSPEPGLPGQFIARGLGSTQIRATYGGKEAFASVTVAGDRFMQVNETLERGQNDFAVSLEVLAAESEGPLEYRVYVAGQPTDEGWIPADMQGGFPRVELRSPQMPYGPQGSVHHLVIEARDPVGGTIQQYPFTFRLTSTIERTDVAPRTPDSTIPY